MEPPTIPNSPFPLITGGFTPAVGQSTDPTTTDSGAIIPQTNVDVKFPVANIAQETISTTLDTERKRIMADYTFEQLGAISIGQFSQGVSGEIDISKDGISAKNINGDTTFDIDGATGDAIFKGAVKAGDVEVINNGGLVSLASFISDSKIIGGNVITSTDYIDITNASLTTPVFTRPTKVLIGLSILMNVDSISSAAWNGAGFIRFDIDGSKPLESLEIQEQGIRMLTGTTPGFATDGVQEHVVSASFITTLSAGVHTIKILGKIENGSGIGSLTTTSTGQMFYVTLGS